MLPKIGINCKPYIFAEYYFFICLLMVLKNPDSRSEKLTDRMSRRTIYIGKGSPYGGSVFRILGDQETDAIHFFQFWENFLALRQLRQVADQNEIPYRTVESRQNGGLTDRLQDHVDDSRGDIFGRGVAIRFSEVGGSGV